MPISDEIKNALSQGAADLETVLADLKTRAETAEAKADELAKQVTNMAGSVISEDDAGFLSSLAARIQGLVQTAKGTSQ